MSIIPSSHQLHPPYFWLQKFACAKGLRKNQFLAEESKSMVLETSNDNSRQESAYEVISADESVEETADRTAMIPM